MVYALVIVSLVILSIALLFAYQSAKYSLKQGWHILVLSLALVVFAYLYGTWVFLTIYIKYAIPVSYLLALWLGTRKSVTKTVRKWKAIPNLLFTIVLGTFCVLYFTGTVDDRDTVEIAFPLKKGRYFVFQGGKGLPTNFFHYSYRGAVFAIDLVKLDAYGNRANKVFSKTLEDYHIFNDTVFSPCNGIIETMHDDNPDNIPPNRERGPSNTNMLVIDGGSYFVFMGHLKHLGVFVKEGDSVKIGQPLALAGNSGFSIEPHLHIQAHAKPSNGEGWYKGKPLLIKFDGRSYLLFETITPRKVEMVQ
ncbi:MAG: hypothetical protein EOO89_00640 [Pedobacter sp.]|nr:MAG: hypothetical protein EOO89_00640 [Pedobacter sp.]